MSFVFISIGASPLIGMSYGDKPIYHTAENEYDSFNKEFVPMQQDQSNQDTEHNELPIILNGSLYNYTSYNFSHKEPEIGQTDHRGLSSLKIGLRLDTESRISPDLTAKLGATGYRDFNYLLYEDKEFTDEYVDENEMEVELNEAWLWWKINKFYHLKIGRQTVRWGKASIIEILDVLNPKDYRILGLADIKDLSLPVYMTRLSRNSKEMSVNMIAVHEVRFNKIPVFGSDFYPGAGPAPPENIPEGTPENNQFGFSLDLYRHRKDFSLNFASFFEDRPHVTNNDGTLERNHSRIELIGGSFSYVDGSWVLFGEIGYLHGLAFFNSDKAKNRLDILTGIEFVGFKDTIIGLEAANRKLLDFQKQMESPPDNAVENEFRLVINLNHDFYYNTFHLNYQLSLYDFDGSGGSYQRFRTAYDISDHWAVIFGVIFYQSGNYFLLRNISDNDRFFLNLNYSF